jgi:hypothetical protein
VQCPSKDCDGVHDTLNDRGGMRRHVADTIFRAAPLVGVQGLNLAGLDAREVNKLELAVRHILRELEVAQRKARRGY